MGQRDESHPDAQSRREMLEQMHRRVRQKLQPTTGQDKAPRHADEKDAPEDGLTGGAIQ